MKKIFKCFVIAVIFSLAYATMPSFVEAVEVSNKLKESMDIGELALKLANEKDLAEIPMPNQKDIDAAKLGLQIMERRFDAEEKSLSKSERQKRLDEIEELKFALWMVEAAERRRLELAGKKQKSLKQEAGKNSEGKSFLETAKETYDEYEMRKQNEDREKARLAEAERQKKKLEEEAKKREQAKKQKGTITFAQMIGVVIVFYIISLFNFPFLKSWYCWLVMVITVLNYFLQFFL